MTRLSAYIDFLDFAQIWFQQRVFVCFSTLCINDGNWDITNESLFFTTYFLVIWFFTRVTLILVVLIIPVLRRFIYIFISMGLHLHLLLDLILDLFLNLFLNLSLNLFYYDGPWKLGRKLAAHLSIPSDQKLVLLRIIWPNTLSFINVLKLTWS